MDCLIKQTFSAEVVLVGFGAGPVTVGAFSAGVGFGAGSAFGAFNTEMAFGAGVGFGAGAAFGAFGAGLAFSAFDAGAKFSALGVFSTFGAGVVFSAFGAGALICVTVSCFVFWQCDSFCLCPFWHFLCFLGK